jgi:transcriptional regulator with XRE-family HTH domain
MMSPIGFRVRELREARGWTQTELAKRAGIRRATVNRLENQRVTSIDLTVLEKLAKALDALDAAHEEQILKLRDHNLGADHPLAEPLDTVLLCDHDNGAGEETEGRESL